MNAHGDITTDYIESAIKRIFGQMKQYKLRWNSNFKLNKEWKCNVKGSCL
jgi:hypothetical protein